MQTLLKRQPASRFDLLWSDVLALLSVVAAGGIVLGLVTGL